MKRLNRYQKGITGGLIVSAIVALWMGDGKITILLSTIAAFIVTWELTLSWERAGSFAKETAGKMNLHSAGDFGKAGLSFLAVSLIVIFFVIHVIFNVLKRVLWEALKVFIKDARIRKVFAYYLVLIGVNVLNGAIYYYLMGMSMSMHVSTGLDFPIAILFGMICTGVALIGVFSAVSMVIGLGAYMFCLNSNDFFNVFKDGEHKDAMSRILNGWIAPAFDDNLSAPVSTLYMLSLRTINASMLLLYPFVLIGWGTIALASKKTLLSATLSSVLAASYVSLSYLSGGIAYTNFSFWFLFIAAIVVGARFGELVGVLTEREVPAMPKIVWLVHCKA